jgi:hypothetical protein
MVRGELLDLLREVVGLGSSLHLLLVLLLDQLISMLLLQ